MERCEVNEDGSMSDDDDGCMYFARSIALLEGGDVPMPMISLL